jgi:hypothetical protein
MANLDLIQTSDWSNYNKDMALLRELRKLSKERLHWPTTKQTSYPYEYFDIMNIQESIYSSNRIKNINIIFRISVRWKNIFSIFFII